MPLSGRSSLKGMVHGCSRTAAAVGASRSVMARLALVVMLFSTMGGAAAANTTAIEPTIYVSNESLLSDDLVAAALPVFQAALDRDFAPAWRADATLQFVRDSEELPPAAWRIVLANETDVGALAYHSSAKGIPIAHIYVASSIEAGDNWEKLFSHELFEMLADPQISSAVWNGSHQIHLLEICDPVQALDFAYERRDADGRPVQVSDFVLPSWFQAAGGPPYDFTGRVHHSGQVLSGGFTNVWRHGSWHELDGADSLPGASREDLQLRRSHAPARP